MRLKPCAEWVLGCDSCVRFELFLHTTGFGLRYYKAMQNEVWRSLAQTQLTLSHVPLNAPDAAIGQIVETAKRTLNCDNAWVLFLRQNRQEESRDAFQGWDVSRVYVPNSEDSLRPELDRWVRDGAFQHDPFALESIRNAGEDRIVSGIKSQRKTSWNGVDYRFSFQKNEGDRLVAVHSISDRNEVHVCFSRDEDSPSFSSAEADLLEWMLGVVAPWARRIALSFGLHAEGTPLSPRERQTLLYLLTRFSEREIADELGVTRKSAHQYVARVYQKLGIHSRPTLLSMWMNPMAWS